MNKRNVLVCAFAAMLAAMSCFGVPSSMVYTGRVMKPGKVSGKVFDCATCKKFNVSVNDSKDKTIWSAKDVPAMVQTNGMFTIELSDEFSGVSSGNRSIKEVFSSGDAAQIIVEINDRSYATREEFVTVPLVDKAESAKKLSSGGDAFILGNLKAHEINVRDTAKLNNTVVTDSFSGMGTSALNISAMDCSETTGITLKRSRRESPGMRILNRSYFSDENKLEFAKVNSNETYTYDDTLLISSTNRAAKVFTDGKRSGLLLITGSKKFPGVVIPFSGEDIKWPFETIGSDETFLMYFFPFGTSK